MYLLCGIELDLLELATHYGFDVIIEFFKFLFQFEVLVSGSFGFCFELLHKLLCCVHLRLEVEDTLEIVFQVAEKLKH